jgi:RNA polymerase sigma-70 factor (sigma-E family)
MALRDEEFHSYVVDRREEPVRTAILLTAGDLHQAEDLVQTTLTRLYLSWPLFTRAANRDGYARRTLVNVYIDEQRRPWRRRERGSSHLPDAPSVEVDTGTERTESVRGALRGLPPRMRAVVVCRYFHDLSVAETADALSCSQGTVKSQTARALDHLRSALNDPLLACAPPPSTTPSTLLMPTTATRSL